jgi:hypothetical protein
MALILTVDDDEKIQTLLEVVLTRPGGPEGVSARTAAHHDLGYTDVGHEWPIRSPAAS